METENVIDDSLKRIRDSEHDETNKRLCNDKVGGSDDSLNELVLNNESINTSLENDASDCIRAPFVRVHETDVGITEYVSYHPGFYAVMKERYSDFLVNEINKEGDVVRLTSLSKPADPESDYQIDGLLDDDTSNKLQDLIDKKVNEVMIEVSDKDKSMRKEIHVALRQKYDGLESYTEDKDEKKFIVVKRFHQSKGKRFRPSIGGNYLHFVLYKENRDTMDTINNIASFLRIQSKVFSYAGSKDKRGKTSQLVSAYRLTPEKLLSINKQFNMIKVGNIVFKNEQLKLGDLMGNLFVIVLRQLNGTADDVEKAVNSLATKGFINYYGLQRFGTSSIPTHYIGRLLLLGDWKGAINLVLAPKPGDDDELAAAKKVWVDTKDAKSALLKLRRKCSIEGKLLSGLATANENDLCNAFGAIPRNMRLMYLHSYQSYIWNKVASKRMNKYGFKVLKGDLVQKRSDVCVDNFEPDCEEGNKKAMLSNMVKQLSEDEVEKFSINDILIPLPGHSVILPDNETKDWYNEFLKEDGISWNNLDSKIRAYSLCGAYRKLITVPSDVNWEIISYSDNTKPLVLSDLDVLMNVQAPENDKNGPLKALKLEFKLPLSSYATMAVREILKCSTSYIAKL